MEFTLVGRARAVPEEDPLQALVALELVFEAESVVLVGKFKEVCLYRLLVCLGYVRRVRFATYTTSLPRSP